MTRRRRRCGAAVVLVFGLASCGGGDPPLESLSLRDALGARPEVIAAMPDDARRQLAERFEAARADDPGPPEVAAPSAAAAAMLVQAVDTARRAAGRDAIVLAAIVPGEGHASVYAVDETPPDHAAHLPPLAGPRAESTAELEARALDDGGHAAATIASALAASRATRLERVVGWPSAVVAVGDTVYVNAAWLVALAPPGTPHAASRSTGSARTGGAIPVPLPSHTLTAGELEGEGAAAGNPGETPDAGVATEGQGGQQQLIPEAVGFSICVYENSDNCNKSCDKACSDAWDQAWGCDKCNKTTTPPTTDDGGTDGSTTTTTNNNNCNDGCGSSSSSSTKTCTIGAARRPSSPPIGFYVCLLAPLGYLARRARGES